MGARLMAHYRELDGASREDDVTFAPLLDLLHFLEEDGWSPYEAVTAALTFFERNRQGEPNRYRLDPEQITELLTKLRGHLERKPG